MKLLWTKQHCSDFSEGTVATIGNFDGVHLGHQALLAQLKAQANKFQLPCVIMLFEPQPNEFFLGQKAPARLSSLREKLDKLASCGVDYVYCLRFNEQLANMPAKQFAHTYCFSLLQARYLLIGEDFHFGHSRLGDKDLLTNMAYLQNCLVEIFADFTLIDAKMISQRISSTKIRELLSVGQLDLASALLGRSYSICGRVVQGDGRGRQWGVPTANLRLHRLSLPLTGVFCVQITRSNGLLVNGVANIGRRPTVDGTKNILEVHLFDFDNNLYGEILQVSFLYRLRDEIKFSSEQALINQIYADIITAKTYFTKINIDGNYND